MSYAINALAQDCYPSTTVLINKLGIQNQQNLDAVEGTLVSAKAALWEQTAPVSTFDFSHYCAIHC